MASHSISSSRAAVTVTACYLPLAFGLHFARASRRGKDAINPSPSLSLSLFSKGKDKQETVTIAIVSTNATATQSAL